MMTQIKKFELTDLDALATLFDDYRRFYRQPSDLDETKKFIAERVKNAESEVFVAFEESGIMTGFVQLYPVFSSVRMRRLWLLNDLYVHPGFRGRGISLALIDKAKELCVATGGCGLILETERSNLVGNALYPRAGFTQDIEHNYYYWDVETTNGNE